VTPYAERLSIAVVGRIGDATTKADDVPDAL